MLHHQCCNYRAALAYKEPAKDLNFLRSPASLSLWFCRIDISQNACVMLQQEDFVSFYVTADRHFSNQVSLFTKIHLVLAIKF